jgi:2-oxoglutarate dehydrogenase E1 component
MDRFSFLGSAHISHFEELYNQYLKHPDSVEPSWRAFFQGYDLAREDYGASPAPAVGVASKAEMDLLEKEFKVFSLIKAYRNHGHLFTKTNPVRTRRSYSPTLDIENFGLSKADLETPFQVATELGLKGPATLAEIVRHLNLIYCQSIGVEYTYIRKPEIADWIKHWIDRNDNQPNLSPAEKKRILHKLNEAVAFEAFLNSKFVGQKRFSIEGGEALIPALDFLVEHAAGLGVQSFFVGMAHRGRLNVLTNIFGKPSKEIFSEFEGKEFTDEGFDGDVKYHLGYSTLKKLDNGQEISLTLSPNPSHLEAVDPVVEGMARAHIEHEFAGDAKKAMPILIHGDAAVAAQGIVYEVAQMETLDGYSTGGTIHIVVNNQVGFTTNYLDARSSIYCTDVAKVTHSPVLHINGDDAEAVVHAIHFAVEYRQRFQRDVYIDLLCYRKYGHNEGDEPRFTQPLLYKAIAKHPNPREIYNQKLLGEGLVGTSIVKEMEAEFKAMLEENYDESKKIAKNFIRPFLEADWAHLRRSVPADFNQSPETAYPLKDLKAIAKALTTLPEGVQFLNKVVKLHQDRANMVEQDKLDWAMGELLAYGTLLHEGKHVRLSGEDVERGTFSHRHAIIKVEDSEEEYCLLNTIAPGKQGRFTVFNSLLSEYAVLGYDYGYAMARPNDLVIWEAQFGDFANGAQIIIDQFISAAEDKWKVQNGLVMMLPHGYEGQGAEHSSARLERFMQLAAQENMFVVNVTTPANYFHVLRRQLALPFRKPLVVMTPKSLLRHPRCTSSLQEMAKGRFQEVIDDTLDPKKVKKVVFVSGKLYYELLEERERRNDTTTALVRVEQLYPFPAGQLEAVVKKYPKAQVVWAQEEPRNMGAWFYVALHFPGQRPLVVSPPESAAPATGSHQAAHALQHKLIHDVFEI